MATNEQIEKAAKAIWDSTERALVAENLLGSDGCISWEDATDMHDQYRDHARAALEAVEPEPDHFYLATFDDVNISKTTDTEPIMMRRYTIHTGPYDNPIDTWDAAWIDDEQWDSAVVLGFKGTDAIYAYHELMSDVPTDGALDATSAEDALFSRGEGATNGNG